MLAVYVAGKADRAMGGKSAPVLLLFITGPVGLCMSVIVYLIHTDFKNDFLDTLYNKGYGK